MSLDAVQLLARVGADTSDAERQMQAFSGKLGNIANDFSGALLKHDLITIAAGALTDFAKTAVDSYAENERLGQSFDTLIAKELRQRDASLSQADALAQASPKAQELLRWNQQLAINSPFTEAGVAATYKQAIAYGFVSDSADKTAISARRLTQDIVDFVAGGGRTEESANLIALALGQIQAKGRLAGQEVNQLAQQGIPVDQILAQAFNKTTAEIVALREKGAIPADAAIKAIVRSIESDFGGAAQRQAGTVAGLISSLQDLERIGARDLLGPAFQAAQPFVQDLVTALQSPETRQSLQEIGASLGTIARDELPVIIQDMRDFAGFTKQVYDLIKPVVDAYHDLENIKLPGGGEVGQIIGLGPLKEFATGGYYRDVTRIYNEITGATDQTTASTKRLAGAFQDGSGGGGTWGESIAQATTNTQAQTSAQEQLTLQVGLTATEQKKLQDQLTRTAEAGDAAAERLQDSQQQFHDQEQRRLQDHQGRLADIEGNARRQRMSASQQYHDRQLEAQQQFHDRVERLQRDAAKRDQDAESTEHERQQGALEEHQGRLLEITQHVAQRIDEERQRQTAHEQAYQDRLQDVQRSAAQRIADDEARNLERRTEAQQQYQDRAADLQRQLVDVQEQAAQQAEDRERTLADRLLDIRRQLADRLRDIQQQASERQQDATERYDDDRRNKAEDHQDKLRDLQERLGEATTDSQRQAIQRQIDQENERYAKQERRAREAYDRAQQEAQEDLQRQIAHAREQAAREKQAAQEQAAREEQRAAEQLARQEQHLTDQQAALDKSYAEQEAKAQAAYERQKAERDRQYADQLAKLKEQRDKENQANAQKYQDDIVALLARQQAENESYEKSERKASEHYTKQREERQADLAAQLAELQSNYDDEEAKRHEAYRKQRHDLDVELKHRLAEENKNFAQQEADARKSYDQQQADLKEALGKQLDAYTTTQEQLTAVTAEQATRRRAIIAAEFGYDPAAAQAEFGRILAQIVGSGTVGGGSTIHSEAAGLTINGDVHVNTPQNTGALTPQEYAQQVRSELIEIGRRNRGLSGGVLGGF